MSTKQEDIASATLVTKNDDDDDDDEQGTACAVCFDDVCEERTSVVCGCTHRVCQSCAEEYILESCPLRPKCMKCHCAWTMTFLTNHFSQVFVTKHLRNAQKKVLDQLVRARMPEIIGTRAMQEYLARKKQQKAFHAQDTEALQTLTTERNALIKSLNVRRKKIMRHWRETLATFRGQPVTWNAIFPTSKLKEVIDKQNELYMLRCQHDAEIVRLDEVTDQLTTFVEKPPRTFEPPYENPWQQPSKTKKASGPTWIAKCARPTCRGFVNNSWTCGICNTRTCRQCLSVQGTTKQEVKAHECDENDKKTAAMVLSSSRPCPQCGVRISRVSGCDQMWCTQCQVAFSWKKGTVIVGGIIHNPHFFEAKRKGLLKTMPSVRRCGAVDHGVAAARDTATTFAFTLVPAHLTLKAMEKAVATCRALQSNYNAFLRKLEEKRRNHHGARKRQ